MSTRPGDVHFIHFWRSLGEAVSCGELRGSSASFGEFGAIIKMGVNPQSSWIGGINMDINLINLNTVVRVLNLKAIYLSTSDVYNPIPLVLNNKTPPLYGPKYVVPTIPTPTMVLGMGFMAYGWLVDIPLKPIKSPLSYQCPVKSTL